MNMPPYFDLLFLVILDYSFEVGFFALFVLVDLLVYSLGQINLFMHFRFLLYAACMYGPNSQVVEFSLEIGCLFYVIIDVEINSYLSKLDDYLVHLTEYLNELK